MRCKICCSEICVVLLLSCLAAQVTVLPYSSPLAAGATLNPVTSDDAPTPQTAESTLNPVTSDDVTSTLTEEEACDILIQDNDNAMSPDTYLTAGDELNLTCSLNARVLPRLDARNISFRFSQASKVRCISSSNVRALNSTTAMVTVSNVSLNDAGQYWCHVYDSCSQEGQGCNSTVGYSSVRVEHPLQNVSNFECVVHNWKSMNCSWTHPVEYVDWTCINVTSSYYLTGGLNQPCPAQSPKYCYWDSVYLTPSKYMVEVKLANTCTNTTTSKTFTVNSLLIVQPDKVENLTARDLTSEKKTGCILLTWNHSITRRSKVYGIKHQRVGEGEWEVLESSLANTSFETCGYGPYTYHNFSVDCLPSGIYSGSRSDPVYLDVWSAMTAPDLGPRATNGSYVSTKCVGDLRDVTLMWQEVEESARNGIIDGYIVRLGRKNISIHEVSVSVELPCSRKSELTIFAYNKAGLSRNPSVLIVSPASLTVPDEIKNSFSAEIITDISHGPNQEQIYLSWAVDEDTKNMTFTVFWCEGQGQTCKSEISWINVPYTETSAAINMSSSMAGAYLYGISVTDGHTGMASDLFWTGCLFTRHPGSMPAVKNLVATSLTERVLISWDASSCFSQYKVKFTNFTIKWGPQIDNEGTGAGWIFNMTVPATISSLTISSLEAGRNYDFTVLPMSFSTLGDEVRPWKTATPTAATRAVSLGAALGGLAAGICVVVVIILVWRNCRAQQRKLETVTGRRIGDVSSTEQPTNHVTVMLMGQTTTENGAQHASTVTVAGLNQPGETEVTTSPPRNCQVPGYLPSEVLQQIPSSRVICTQDIGAFIDPPALQITSEVSEDSPSNIATSNYIQLNIHASHSDDSAQCNLPQNTAEMQTYESNNQLPQEGEACTSFSGDSFDNLIPSLPSNGYTRLRKNNAESDMKDSLKLGENNGELKINDSLQFADSSQSECGSQSTKYGDALSFPNCANCQPSPTADSEQEQTGGYITQLSSAYVTSAFPLPNPVPRHGNVRAESHTETGVDEKVCIIAVGHEEDNRITENQNSETAFIDTTTLQYSHSPSGQVSTIVQPGINSTSEFNQIQEISSQQSRMDNFSGTTHPFTVIGLDVSETDGHNTGMYVSHVRDRDSGSSSDIDTASIHAGYVQLRELSSINGDISEESLSNYDSDYIQH